MTSRRVLIIACVLQSAQPGPAAAQTPPAETFTLGRAIQYAADHYPSVEAALAQIDASSAAVRVARTAYLPRLDGVWQTTRATTNNIFGQLLPQSVIPAMSGPVLPSTSGDSVWGSAAGALVSWEPIDFGLRGAAVAAADAAVESARSRETLTRLEVQRAAGSAFLAAAAAARAVAAAQADVDRRETLRGVVQTLVDNQLRPGAEASRADAELAAARTRLVQATQAVALATATLARVLAVSPRAVAVDAATLVDRLPATDLHRAPPRVHPLAQVHRSAVDQARAAETVLARTDWPRIYLQSSLFARGSGATPSGPFDGGMAGLGFDRVNWAAGVQVVLPNAFDYAALRARKAAGAAAIRAESALYDEAALAITSDQQAAAASLEAARAVAANTPIELGAARQSEAQARARYQAGLASILEIADAQTLLASAELHDALAHIDVWRALLGEAAAAGDLTPFLSLLQP